MSSLGVSYDASTSKFIQVPCKMLKPKLGANDVQIDVKSCALDMSNLEENIACPDNMENIVGVEFHGRIVAIGKSVSKLRAGDNVIAISSSGVCKPGTVVVNEHMVLPVPIHVDGQAAIALIRPCITAYVSVFYKMKVQRGDTVMIANPMATSSILVAQLVAQLGGFCIIPIFETSTDKEDIIENYDGIACCKLISLAGMVATDGLTWEDNLVHQLCDKETDGLGCDHVFLADLVSRTSSDQNRKSQEAHFHNALLRSLGVNGTFVSTVSLPINKSLSDQLLEKSCTVALVSASPWVRSPKLWSRTLHIVHDMLVKLEASQLSLPTPQSVVFSNETIERLNDMLSSSSFSSSSSSSDHAIVTVYWH